MKKQELPTTSNLTVVDWLCNIIPDRMVPKTVLETNVDAKARTFFARLQEVNDAIEKAETGREKPEKLTLAKLRAALGWSRNQLAQVMNASDRAIVNWEAGDPMSPVYAAKLREIQGIY
jgi:DNA-binding transcriptional regulator YiaG